MPKVQQNGGSGSGRGRRARGLRVSTSLAEINVVPLVDVMLVLLIIFMVAAPMMTQGMQVNLPVARKSPNINVKPIYITVPATFAADRMVQIGDETIRVDVLAERVRQTALTLDEKSLFVRGDGAVQYQDVMDVFGRLKEAGVQKVGVVVQERRAQP